LFPWLGINCPLGDIVQHRTLNVCGSSMLTSQEQEQGASLTCMAALRMHGTTVEWGRQSSLDYDRWHAKQCKSGQSSRAPCDGVELRAMIKVKPVFCLSSSQPPFIHFMNRTDSIAMTRRVTSSIDFRTIEGRVRARTPSILALRTFRMGQRGFEDGNSLAPFLLSERKKNLTL
jgi:hypothetical protein